MGSHKLASTAVSYLASVQSNTRLVYTAAPSDRPFSAVGFPPGPSPPPAPVRGSVSGGDGGSRGAHPLMLDIVYPTRLLDARVVPGLEETGPGVHPFSRGAFGEGAPTAVGDQFYLGP